MGTIISSNSFNPANLQAPGLYIDNIPPTPYIPGAPTNVAAVVGTASWGPVNSPQIMSSPPDTLTYFGGITSAALTDVHDLCTDATIAFQQGFISVYGIRVTDSTDISASVVLAISGSTATALWSGTAGNSISVVIQNSTFSGYMDVIISSTFAPSERYPRLPNTSAFWAALKSALSAGIVGVAPPSNMVRTTITGGGTAIPVTGTYTLTGGTDGRTVTTDQLLGQNQTFPPTGVYTAATPSPTPEKVWIAGLTDTTAAATLQAFCESAAMQTALAFPTGTSTALALSTISSVGVHSYELTYLKDWVYWNDTVNGVIRLVPPLPFAMGLITALAPSQSPLNKAVNGVIGTERNSPYTGNVPYSQGEIGQLEQAGVLVITNPIPQGSVFGYATGNNTALNTAETPIEYASMTNFLDQSFNGFMGTFVGQLQTARPKDPLRRKVRHVLNNFLNTLVDAGLIDEVVQITCTLAQTGNPQLGINTPATIAQHYLYAFVAVRYLSSVRYFVLALQGGTTVVSSSPTQPA